MLGFFCRIGSCGVRLGCRRFNCQRVQVAGLGQDRLPQRQRRCRLMPGVVVGAPQWRRAIKLLEYRDNHPRSIIHRCRVAPSVIGHQQLARLLGLGQEPSQSAIGAVIEQPAKTQQYMLRANGPNTLFNAPQRLAAQPKRDGFVFFAVGRRPRAIEHPIAGRLQQDDVVVLAQLRQTLDSALLAGKPGLAY